jgi:hypothetical protein
LEGLFFYGELTSARDEFLLTLPILWIGLEDFAPGD